MIKFDEVLSVYSGKPGCCCGCQGKYYYREDLKDEGTKSRGYAVSDDECNDKMVHRIINKLNKTGAIKEDNHYFLDTGTRWYIAYLRD